MSLIITHNIAAMNTQRYLNGTNRNLQKSLERLSSGYKINVAGDNPSGLIISEQLRSQASGLERAIQNSQEASNVLAIAEGALIEMNEILRKMKELALHAANSGITAPDQISADQAEVDSGIQTLDRIANTTRYSDQYLLNGSKGLVYDRTTSVDSTADEKLIDIGATRIDQVFKRSGVSMTTTFAGVIDPNQADATLEARRAYFEADDNNTNADISGWKLSDEQSFVVTGTKGSRLFNFAADSSLGSVVSSINNVKDSTGVSATLIFASNISPDMTGSNSANLRTAARAAGQIQVYGANINSATAKVTAATVLGAANASAAGFRVGLNCDGEGRVYAKVISNAAANQIEWYKDKDCTMLIGTQTGATFTAANGSGVTGVNLTLTANAVAGDVYTVAMVGLEGANIDQTAGANDAGISTGLNTWTGLSLATSAISGVNLGTNTSSDGILYFRASGANTNRTIEIFKTSEMNQQDLVATGTMDLSAANRQIHIESVIMDNGQDSGLNLTLSFTGAANNGGTETGQIAFDKLGVRLYSNDYGSTEYVRIQNRQGDLFSYYRKDDQTTATMVGAGETVQRQGQDATIAINGAPLRTQGLTASVTTMDFAGDLVFNEGKLGATTIAQSGFTEGSLYSRATALQTVVESTATSTLLNTYTYATNARHTTTETLYNFIGGMQYQLGGGEGDQERTVYGIPSMAAINVGRVVIDGQEYTLNDVLAGGDASLQNDPIMALRVIAQAVDDVSTLRARIGAYQKNMLQTNINSLEVTVQNITMTESAIRDANMAEETTDFTKNQILLQAGTAMLAQANTASQNILQLLG